jgi:hypothetical protein
MWWGRVAARGMTCDVKRQIQRWIQLSRSINDTPGENQSDDPQCAYSNLPSTRCTHLFYTRYHEQLAQMSECQRQRDRWGLTF